MTAIARFLPVTRGCLETGDDSMPLVAVDFVPLTAVFVEVCIVVVAFMTMGLRMYSYDVFEWSVSQILVFVIGMYE